MFIIKKSILIVIFCVLSVIFIFTLSSCKSNSDGKQKELNSENDSSTLSATENDSVSGNEKNNTEDYSAEIDKIMAASLEQHENYSFTAQKYKYNGSDFTKANSTKVIFCDDGWVMYANNGTDGGLFINKGKKYYSINVPQKTKKLVAEGEATASIDWKSNISEFSSLMTEHKSYSIDLYKRELTESIANRNCAKYKINAKDLAASPELEYWFDLDTGLIIKAITKTQFSDTVSINRWEMLEFNIGGQSIEEYINFKEIK